MKRRNQIQIGNGILICAALVLSTATVQAKPKNACEDGFNTAKATVPEAGTSSSTPKLPSAIALSQQSAKYVESSPFDAFFRRFDSNMFSWHALHAISPDNKLIAAVQQSTASVRIYDLETGDILLSLYPRFGDELSVFRPTIRELRFSEDGKSLIIASTDGDIALLSLSDQKTTYLQKEFNPEKPSLLVSMNAAGGTLVASYKNDLLEVWDQRTGTRRIAIESGDKESKISSSHLSPDGKQLASIRHKSIDVSVEVTDLESGKSREIVTASDGLLGSHSEPAKSVEYRADGMQLAVVRLGIRVDLFNTQTFKINTSIVHKGIRSAKYSPDGKTIITLAADGTIKTWDVRTGELLDSASVQGSPLLTELNHDGSRLLVVNSKGELFIHVIGSRTTERIQTIHVVFARFLDNNRIMTIDTYGRVSILTPQS